MNWRGGFRRVAIALAALYWLAALGIAWASSQDAVRATFATGYAGGDYAASRIDITVPDGRQVVAYAYDWPTANAIAQQWARDNPRQEPFAAGSGAFIDALGWAALWFLGLYALYRGLRWIALGFAKPGNQEPA